MSRKNTSLLFSCPSGDAWRHEIAWPATTYNKNPAMVAWKNQLSDLEIAGVITYERNAFGNKTGDLVQPKDIAAAHK